MSRHASSECVSLHLSAGTTSALFHFPAMGLVRSPAGLLPFAPPCITRWRELQLTNRLWQLQASLRQNLKSWREELVGPQKWQAIPFQGPVWEDQRGGGSGLPLWAPKEGLKIWKYFAVWLSHWFCTVPVNSGNLPSGPFYSSALPLLPRVWVCVSIYLFICHTLSPFRPLYVHHVLTCVC